MNFNRNRLNSKGNNEIVIKINNNDYQKNTLIEKFDEGKFNYFGSMSFKKYVEYWDDKSANAHANNI